MNSDPVESASKGATKGLLEYSEDKIKSWVRKFLDKNLAFIENEDTIKTVKNQRRKSEFEVFKNYIDDKELRILFQLGLSLRQLEKEKKDFIYLQTRINNKYGKEKLHITYFVQNGLFSKYLANVLDKELTIEQTKKEIKDLFENIDKKVIFIKQYDKVDQKIKEIITKIHAHSPDTFIISSVGSAIEICEQIKNGVMESTSSNYLFEEYSAEGRLSRNVYFLNRTETI